jgi:hypothetical protein
MLTYQEEIALHRLRACLGGVEVAFWAAIVVAVACVAGALADLGEPRALYVVALFELTLALFAAAFWRRLHRRVLHLEQFES